MVKQGLEGVNFLFQGQAAVVLYVFMYTFFIAATAYFAYRFIDKRTTQGRIIGTLFGAISIGLIAIAIDHLI